MIWSHYRYDYIEVYDGNEDLAELIGQFCGTTKPSAIVSTSRELLLKFRSDDTVNWKGFHAKYFYVDPFSEESVAPTQPPANQTSVRKTKPRPSTITDTLVVNTDERGDSAAPVSRSAIPVTNRIGRLRGRRGRNHRRSRNRSRRHWSKYYSHYNYWNDMHYTGLFYCMWTLVSVFLRPRSLQANLQCHDLKDTLMLYKVLVWFLYWFLWLVNKHGIFHIGTSAVYFLYSVFILSE